MFCIRAISNFWAEYEVSWRKLKKERASSYFDIRATFLKNLSLEKCIMQARRTIGDTLECRLDPCILVRWTCASCLTMGMRCFAAVAWNNTTSSVLRILHFLHPCKIWQITIFFILTLATPTTSNSNLV